MGNSYQRNHIFFNFIEHKSDLGSEGKRGGEKSSFDCKCSSLQHIRESDCHWSEQSQHQDITQGIVLEAHTASVEKGTTEAYKEEEGRVLQT